MGRSKVWRKSGKSSESQYIMECTNDVRVQRRKGSEWWNEEVGGAVAEKSF